MITRHRITDKQQWLELRKQDVTASDVGALFDCHPYRTLAGLFSIKSSEDTDEIDNVVMRRGRIFEDAVRTATLLEYPDWEIERCDDYFRDTDIRLGCTPDFIVSRPDRDGLGLMQAKTIAPNIAREHWSEESPPPHIVLQALVEMMLHDLQWTIVAGLVIQPWKVPPPMIYEIPRHPEMEARIIEETRKFWEMVENGTPPPRDYNRDGALIEKLYRQEDGAPPLDLNGDNYLLAQLHRRDDVAEKLKLLKEEKDAIDAELKDKLGTNSEAICKAYRITWKTQQRKEYVVPATTLRVLRVSRIRGAASPG
jgi:predicted phage-related endonuclease